MVRDGLASRFQTSSSDSPVRASATYPNVSRSTLHEHLSVACRLCPKSERFEICYDSLWKVLRRHLIEALGIVEIPNSPRPIFRIADENRLLAAGVGQWELYMRTRIDTTHDYDQQEAARAIGVMAAFIDDATRLCVAMTGEAWE